MSAAAPAPSTTGAAPADDTSDSALPPEPAEATESDPVLAIDSVRAVLHVEELLRSGQIQGFSTAQMHFEHVLFDSPTGPQRHLALWGLGWIRFRTGDFASSRRFFRALDREDPYGELTPAAMYWAARAALELGQPQLATTELQALCGRFPHDYYAWAAALSPGDARASHAQASELTRRDVKRVLTSIAAGTPLRAAKAIDALAAQAGRLDPTSLHTLAKAAARLGRPQLEARFLQESDWRFGADPGARARLASRFPAAIVHSIVEAAQHEHVPADLAVAVAFALTKLQPDTSSRRGALGMFQLGLAPGLAMLREGGRRKSATAEVLADSAINIRLSVRLLGRLYRSFGRRAEYALSAWHAGPGAVTAWRASHGDLPTDIFVEEIPDAATRAFVREVLGAAQVYRFAVQESAPEPQVAAAR